MASKATFATAAMAALSAAQPAVAAPAGEPLVVTQLRDPDPNYVTPKAEPKAARRPHRKADDNPTLDQAFENLGRVTGQLAKVGAQNAKSNPNWEAEARERLQELRGQASVPRN